MCLVAVKKRNLHATRRCALESLGRRRIAGRHRVHDVDLHHQPRVRGSPVHRQLVETRGAVCFDGCRRSGAFVASYGAGNKISGAAGMNRYQRADRAWGEFFGPRRPLRPFGTQLWGIHSYAATVFAEHSDLRLTGLAVLGVVRPIFGLCVKFLSSNLHDQRDGCDCACGLRPRVWPGHC